MEVAQRRPDSILSPVPHPPILTSAVGFHTAMISCWLCVGVDVHTSPGRLDRLVQSAGQARMGWKEG